MFKKVTSKNELFGVITNTSILHCATPNITLVAGSITTILCTEILPKSGMLSLIGPESYIAFLFVWVITTLHIAGVGRQWYIYGHIESPCHKAIDQVDISVVN
jgi:hypothetical protein